MNQHPPLLGLWAVIGANADLYRRQQAALEAAYTAYEANPKEPPWVGMTAAIDAYLKAMRQSENRS